MDNQAPQVEQRATVPAGAERRPYGDLLEVRKMDDGKNKLRGYALTWNKRYDMGFFTEEIDRAALDGADMTDVRALLNHDPNFVLGRTTAGTLKLSTDEKGLMYEIDLPDTQTARDLAVSIQRGDISQSSWGFMLRYDENTAGDEWKRDNGRDHRIIRSVSRVFDVSPVTYPANPDTTVAKRSLETAQAEWQAAEDARKEKEEKINQRSAQVRAILAQYPQI